MLILLAVAELTLSAGVDKAYRATHDTALVVSTLLSDRRATADPFLLARVVTRSCDSSGAECHRSQSAVVGLRLHPWDAAWFGIAVGAGVGRVTAFAGPRPANSVWTPGVGDLIPVLASGIDVRIPVAGPLSARFDVNASSWPSWPFKSLVELDGTAGLTFLF